MNNGEKTLDLSTTLINQGFFLSPCRTSLISIYSMRNGDGTDPSLFCVENSIKLSGRVIE